MKVEKQGTVQFKDVKVGQVFEWDGKIFMRILTISTPDTDHLRLANSVNLQKGTDASFKDLEEVTLYEDAKVVLK